MGFGRHWKQRACARYSLSHTNMVSPAVGIDLGTTNSVVAVSMQGKPRVITDPATGSPLIPSVVSFPEGGGRLVGRAARARKAFDPAHTVSSVKRLLGRPFKSEEVRRARSRVSFELKEGADSAVMVQTRAGSFSLPEISAMVLREVRRVAEASLEQRVERCVVTVPANFNELQRSSTKIAGKIAELDVVRILNEPTAAALAYGYGRNTREKICIYDFGGGTFDVTLLELDGNVFEVLSTWGDTFLGGDDVDLAITDWLLPHLLRDTGVDATQDRTAFDILRDAAEAAKCALTQREVAQVEFNYAPPGSSGLVRFEHPLTRSDLDRLASPFIEKTFAVCQEALKLAGLRPTDLTAVILVGGSTRIPGLHGRVAQFFGREPLTHLPPEEVVALGAAILAEALTPGARRTRHTPVPMGAPSQPPPISPSSVPPRAPSTAPPKVHASTLRSTTLTGTGTVPPPSLVGQRTLPPAPSVSPSSQVPPPIPNQRPTPRSAPSSTASPPSPNTIAMEATVSFDLDDPFAENVAGARTVAMSTQKPTPLPGSVPGLTELDEPSFVGRLSSKEPSHPVFDQPVSAFNLDEDSVVTPIPTPAMVAAVARHNPEQSRGFAAVPAQKPPDLPTTLPRQPTALPQSSSALTTAPVTAPTLGESPPDVTASVKPSIEAPPRPSSPSVQPVLLSEGLSATIASLPPAIAAAIRPPPPKPSPPDVHVLPEEPRSLQAAVKEASVPSFRLDTSLFGEARSPAQSSPERSVPSFRIDVEDIFGAPAEPGSGTLVAKSPVEEIPQEGASPASLSSDDSTPSPPPVEPVPVAHVQEPTHPAPLPEAPPRVRTPEEPTRTRPVVIQDDPNLPPLVVPAPVKSNVDAIRGDTSRASTPPSTSIGRVSLVSVPVAPGGDTLKPGLPPGPVRSPPPTSTTSPLPPTPPAATQSTVPGRATNVAGITMPLLLDVTPLSLGVETAGGQCEVVIRRNATIPVEQSRVFATTHDNQTSVIIRIAQGESRKFSENQALGELELSGLRPAPRGEVSIAVTFELGVDGTLNVRAKDVETNREQSTRVSLLTLPSEASQAEMAARQRTVQPTTT